MAEKYSEETGVKIEPQGLPAGQLRPDAAHADPGRQRPGPVGRLARRRPGRTRCSRWPRPATSSRSATRPTELIPEGNEGLFQLDGETYAQPTDIIPVGMLWNVGAASDAGVEVPEDTDALLDACGPLADEGKSFFAIAGSVPPNPGLMTHGDLRDPRVRRDPGLERSSAPPATSPSPTTRAGRRPCRRSST